MVGYTRSKCLVTKLMQDLPERFQLLKQRVRNMLLRSHLS